MPLDRVAVEMTIHGRVQGVGFRYFAQQCAISNNITGTVKNLSDGSVRIRAAGSRDNLAEFKKRIERGPAIGRVDDISESTLNVEEIDNFHEFHITY